jgi:hypothetical protein
MFTGVADVVHERLGSFGGEGNVNANANILKFSL